MFSEKKLKIEIFFFDYTPSIGGLLDVDFTSGKKVVFEDFAADCYISKVPSTAGYTAKVDIFGVSQEHLNQITSISWLTGYISPKRIRIWADDGDGYQLLFEGSIMYAVPNYSKVPEVSIHIESSMLAYYNVKPVSSNSFQKQTSISTILKTICSSYGINCEIDSSLLGKISQESITFDQDGLGDRIEAARGIFDFAYQLTSSGYKFMSKGAVSRLIYKFTPEDYNGYPTFTSCGIKLDTNNLLKINCTDIFTITGSEVLYANDTWTVTKVEYRLQPRRQGGKWDMSIYGGRIINE